MDKETIDEVRGLLKQLITVLGENSIHAQVIVECMDRNNNEEMIEEWLKENCATDAGDKVAEEYLEKQNHTMKK